MMTDAQFKKWKAKRERQLDRLGKPLVLVNLLENGHAQVTVSFTITPKERVAMIDCHWNDPQDKVADVEDITENMREMVRGEREMWLDYYPGAR